MTSLDWVVKGAEVAEFMDSHYGIPHTKLTTIERLTDTQVVCANGNRYSRTRTTYDGSGLRAIGSSTYDLRSVVDQRVVSGLSRNYLAGLFSAVHHIERGTQSGRVDVAATLAEVEQAVAIARANIENLGG